MWVPLFVLLGAVHLATLEWDVPILVMGTTKLLPMLLMIVASVALAKTHSPRWKTLRTLALLFSMVGDTLLIFSAEWCFLGGLAAFLVGHIFYNILFVRSSLMPVLGVFCFATSGSIVYLLLDFFPPDLRIPVLVYVVMLSATAWRSAAAAFSGTTLSLKTYLAGLGGLIFLVSDAVLAVDRFIPPHILIVPHARVVVMTTYYLAQLALFHVPEVHSPHRTPSSKEK